MIFTARCTVVQSAVLRLHVIRPSATLMDQEHRRCKPWKLIARTISPTSSLFPAQRPFTYSQGNMGKFGGEQRWGGTVGKVACCSTKAAISLKRVKIEEKLLWRAYRKLGTHQRSFEPYHPRPPTASSSPRLGVRKPTQNCNRYYLRNG